MAVSTDGGGQQRLKRDGVRCRAGELVAGFAQLLHRNVLKGQLHVLGHSLGHIHGDDGLQRGVLAQASEVASCLVPHNGYACAVVLELAAQLVLGVERVVGNNGSAELQGGNEGNDELRAVRHHQRDAVTRADAKRLQASRTAADLAVKLGIRGGATEEVQGVLVGLLGQRFVVDVQDGVFAEFYLCWRPLCVAGKPCFFFEC